MRQGIGLVLVLVLLLVGAGVFVVTAVSLRSSATASAATLSASPSQSDGAAVAAPMQQTHPVDSATGQSLHDDESDGVTFYRVDHQGYCDGDKAASSAGY